MYMVHGQGGAEILSKKWPFFTPTVAGSNLFESSAPLNIIMIYDEIKWESQKNKKNRKIMHSTVLK